MSVEAARPCSALSSTNAAACVASAKPDAVLVMDDLPAHKAKVVRQLLDRSAFSYRYLPSCSPDLNPIELAWAKIKDRLRELAARTGDALREALGPALDAITSQDAHGFFRHASYIRLN